MCCEEECQDKILSVSENKKRFVIQNPNQLRVKKVTVDGCLFKDEDILRCDYLFEIDNPMKIVKYVELKGKDINHAYNQLCSTMNHMKRQHADRSKYCYIVAQRFPRSGPSSQLMKVKMKRAYNALLEIKTHTHTVKI